MDKLKYIKIEDEDGNLSDNIPIGADAKNIDTSSGLTAEEELSLIKDENKTQKEQIEALQNQIKASTNGSPLAADSISEMTDTSRIYVNTTNGHWYYYSNSSWNDGGVYQAIEIADESVTPKKTDFVQSYNVFNYKENGSIKGMYISTATKTFTTSYVSFGVVVKVKPSRKYTIYKPVSPRFSVVTSAEYPAAGVSYTNIISSHANSDLIALETESTTNYLYIIISNTNSSLTDIVENIKVIESKYYCDNFSNEIVIPKLKIENINYDIIPFIKRINLFNKNNYVKANFMKSSSANEFVYSGIQSVIFKCKPNTTYTIQKISSARFILYTSTDFPSIGVYINNTYSNKLNNGVYDYFTINTNENDNYITIYLFTNSDSVTYEEIINSLMILESGESLLEYVPYESIEIDKSLIKIEDKKCDISSVSDDIINLLSYKPVGPLTKGYIALTCDDGANALATHTIPKIKEYKNTYGKNIPVTFGLMSNSQIFSNTKYKALVQEMISEYGCEVAIHGADSYTSYTLDELKDFLDSQKAQLTELCGAEPKSIIYPNHDYNIKTSTLAGSYFGVCCTGGLNTPIKYDYYTVGPRSNMYTLYRMSLFNASVTKERIKNTLDYVKSNNLIIIPFWHDIGLTQDGSETFTAEFKKELLDYVVSYGLEIGLNFITVSDIKNII